MSTANTLAALTCHFVYKLYYGLPTRIQDFMEMLSYHGNQYWLVSWLSGTAISSFTKPKPFWTLSPPKSDDASVLPIRTGPFATGAFIIVEVCVGTG